jgi:hypothetical protein
LNLLILVVDDEPDVELLFNVRYAKSFCNNICHKQTFSFSEIFRP